MVEGEGWTIRTAREESTRVGNGLRALAAIRPEALTVSEGTGQSIANAVTGRLAGVSHLGDVIQFVVMTSQGKEVLARVPRTQAPRLSPGAEVTCSWDAEYVHVFGAEQADLVLADPAADNAKVATGP